MTATATEQSDRRARILFAVTQTGSRANGGVESITQIIEGLKGYRPIVLTQLETPVNERWRRVGEVHVFAAPPRKAKGAAARLGKLLEIVRSNLTSARLVKRLKCPLVHCNDIFAFVLYGFGARLAGAKVVFNIRDTKPDDSYGPHWRLAYRLSAAVIVLSREMAAMVARSLAPGGKSSKIVAIYSAVKPVTPLDGPGKEALRQSLGIGADRVALGVVGVFSPKKAQLPFIERCLPTLLSNHPSCHVYFLGDFDLERNPYARECAAALEKRRLEQSVTVVGFTDRVHDWYQALDATAMVSTREGLARGMIESLACGTPVVSFDVCSAREILEGRKCGIVVPQGNYGELTDALSRLVVDAGLRQEQGAAGAQTARDLFSPEQVVSQYEALYQTILGKRD